MLSDPPTVETCAKELRLLSRRPRRRVVRAGLDIAAATAFFERAAAEHHCIFYAAAAELLARSYQISSIKRKNEGNLAPVTSYELLLLLRTAVKNIPGTTCLATEYKKP